MGWVSSAWAGQGRAAIAQMQTINHSSHKYLLSALGTTLGIRRQRRKKVTGKKKKNLCPHEAYILLGKTDKT